MWGYIFYWNLPFYQVLKKLFIEFFTEFLFKEKKNVFGSIFDR